jgi:hypothetical protein
MLQRTTKCTFCLSQLYYIETLLTYILAYSMEQSPSWEANRFSGSQEVPHILWNYHLSLPWASSIQSIPPHPTFWRSVLILSSLLCHGLPISLFPSGFPTKTLYTPLPSLIRAICPANLILLDFITHTILFDEYRTLKHQQLKIKTTYICWSL